MPNWAFNTNVIYSNQKETIQDFYKKIQSWINSPSLYPKAWMNDPKWLGNIMLHAGFTKEQVTDNNFAKCAGDIIDISIPDQMILDGKEYHFLVIKTETKWNQMAKMWPLLFSKLYPEDKTLYFCYLSEESQNGIHERYNPNNMLRLIEYTGKENFQVSTNAEELDEEKTLDFPELPEDNQLMTKQEVKELIEETLQIKITANNFESNFDNYCQKFREKLPENIYMNFNEITEITTLENEE